MATYNPDDLGELEVTFLGVLCLGLPPSRAAGDDAFRADYVTAVVASLAETGQKAANLDSAGARVSAEFAAQLRAAIAGLTEKGLVARAPAGLPAPPGGFEAGLEVDLVNPDEQPAVLDRYLAQLCMEKLFNIPAVYPYLMERYASSGAVWRRLRERGYGS
ncbi:MAG: hypothetical protein WEC33_01475 [Dehalococcoidia bacterium]